MHLTFFSCFGLSLCMFVTAYGSSFVEVKQTVTDDTIQGDFADEGNCNVRCINIYLLKVVELPVKKRETRQQEEQCSRSED